MKLAKIGLIAFVLFCGFSSLFAQDYHLRHYTGETGLPQAQVFAIMQDHDGYLWFGTGGGAARYDGANYHIVTKEDGLNSYGINCLFQDSRANIWFGTGTGATLFDGKNYTQMPSQVDDSRIEIVDIQEDDRGRIWLSSTVGVFLAENGEYERHMLPDSTRLYSVAVADDGYWFSSADSLFWYDKTNYRDIAYDFPEIYLRLLKSLPNGHLVIGSDVGLYYYDGHQVTHIHLSAETGGEDYVYSIFTANDNTYWVGTATGAYHLRGTNIIRHLTTANGLPENTILSIYQDRENNLWFGSGKGVSKLQSFRFRNYYTRHGLPDNYVNATFVDQRGELWFGTDLGVAHWDGRQFTTFVPTNDPGAVVWAIGDDAAGNLYFGLESTTMLIYYDGRNFIDQTELVNPNPNSSGRVAVFNIFRDRDNKLWFGTDDGFTVFDGDSARTYDDSNGFTSYGVPNIKQDRQGKMWLATEQMGLWTFAGDSLVNMTKEDGLPDNTVEVLFEDSRGYLWVGTDIGLAKYDGQTFKIFKEEDGLANNLITAITEDRAGNIWVGSLLGVNKITDDKVVAHYDKSSGLAASEFSTANAAICDSAGHLWFGFSNGLTEYVPQDDLPNTKPPLVYITEVKLDDDVIDQPDSTRFKFYQNTFRFSYVGLSFKDEADVRYQYLLHGYDHHWSEETTERSVRYTNLNNGTYTFRVKARNRENVWSPVESYTVIINPPFWETWWFIALVCLFFIFLITSIFIYQTKRLQRQKELELIQQREEMKRQRVQEELEQARQIQMSLLPPRDPIIDGLDIAGTCIPATEVGGDYFDYLPLPNKRLGVVVGDVAGHGVSSGILMAMAKSCLYNQINTDHAVETVLNSLNDMILNASRSSTFMTFFYAIIDVDKLTISFSMAGHPHPFHYSAKDGSLTEFGVINLPLGVRDFPFESASKSLDQGDILVFYTDGLTESQNADFDLFGAHLLAEALEEVLDRSAAEIRDHLIVKAADFRGQKEQNDDVTLVVIKVLTV